MSQGPLPIPLHRHQSTPCMDSACNFEQESLLSLHASTVMTNTIYAHLHSSSRMKDFRIPPRSSSSSDDPLAPVPYNFKRWRHPRQSLFATLPPRHCKNDGLLSPASFILDQVDERPSSSAAAPTTSKLCIQKVLSSAKCASIQNQQSDTIDSVSSKRRNTVDLHCEEAPAVTGDDIDVDKEDKRKLIVWRAACAMAHAYLHRHDQHQHDLHRHQHDLHQRNQHSHIPRSGHLIYNVELNDEIKQVNGPLLQEENYDLRRVTEHINDPVPSASSPPPTSSKDGVSASSMCLVSDVVCIDEVVNPTQAAEWFGAVFSSTSTLVS